MLLQSRILACAIGLVVVTAAVAPTIRTAFSPNDHSRTTALSAPVVAAHVTVRGSTRVSARTLLAALPVRPPTHADSYRRSDFELWIDADHDCESTRVEVLKAESRRPVHENAHCTVTTGRWVSPYDGKVVTAARKLDIDHRVPLEEAWVSGAASWSAAERKAYANDLGYGPSLVAVTAHANRSKGDQDPAAWLPSRASDRCAYVRDWIAVKYRWGLSVDGAEESALDRVLDTCASVQVRRPGIPDLRVLDGS